MTKLLLTIVTAAGLLSGCVTSRGREARERERAYRAHAYCDPAQQACDCPPNEPCRPYGYYGPPGSAPPDTYGRGYGGDGDEDADRDRRRERREDEERGNAREHHEREEQEGHDRDRD